MNPYLLALIGTGFTFICTSIGASSVFFIKKGAHPDLQKVFMGFAAGIMIAASIWSLLIPAIEMAEENGNTAWIPAAGGFLLGGCFLWLLDTLLPHLHPGSSSPEGINSSLKRSTMLFIAVTLHNIPEGMAVGLTFGMASDTIATTIASTLALGIGIGLQNIPEGAAISLPLKEEGFSSKKAFIYGTLSGVVEPISGILGVFLIGSLISVMPWLLSFAAGAMIYVVAEELIPEANKTEHSNLGTIGVMIGFVIMMTLDIALA
jgi:ZIP family zinc transporter